MLKNNKHTCDYCIHNEVCEWAVSDKSLFRCDNFISNTDLDIIKHMEAIKAYCKKCSSCMSCPMFDNCTSVNIPEVDVKRFPRYWHIPEVT